MKKIFLLFFSFLTLSLQAQIQPIDTGLTPNDGNGDTPRDAMIKVNSNFDYMPTLIHDSILILKEQIAEIYAFLNMPPTGRTYYGTVFGADGVGNMQIRKQDAASCVDTVDIRFKAEVSGTVSNLKLFYVYTIPGYAKGTGGKLRITLETDDGSANHWPSGVVLATITDNDPRGHTPPDDHYFHVTLTFDHVATLTAGTLYHLKFLNTDTDPINNYMSINNLYCRSGSALDRMPTTSTTDLALLWSTNGGSYNLYTLYTPIFDVIYSNGAGDTTGQGYVGASPVQAPDTIYGTNYKVRDNLTITGGNKTVDKIWVRVSRVSGTEALTIRLEEGGGTLIEAGTVPASSVDISLNSDLPLHGTWVSFTLTTPYTLVNGSTYHVVLSTGTSTIYRTWGIQNGKETWDYATEFDDGHFERTKNNSTWTDFSWGDYIVGTAYKLQCYFEVVD